MAGEKRQSIWFQPAGEPSNKPSGVTTSQSSPLFKLTRVASNSPVCARHKRTLPSSLPDTTNLPSLLKSTAAIGPVCPLRERISLPLARSHSLIVLSQLPEASIRPSRLNARPLIKLLCPASALSSAPVCVSHTLMENVMSSKETLSGGLGSVKFPL